MNAEFLEGLKPDEYPYDAHYATELRSIFDERFLRELTNVEKEALNKLTFVPLLFGNRSGSNLLTECLHLSGMGFPNHGEPMNTPSVKKISQRHQIETFTDYFLFLIQRYQRNNVIGFKMGINQLFDLTRTGLTQHFGNVKLLQSLRHDRLAQAVSHYIAKASGSWSTMQKQELSNDPPYSAEAILRFLRRGARLEADSRLFTTIHGTPSLEVWYEDFVKDAKTQVRAIADFLGCEADVNSVNLTTTAVQPQNRAINVQYANRFRNEMRMNA